MLYPQENETRELKDLAGIWRFKVDRTDQGFANKWYAQPLTDTIEMPVPASYNDITQDPTIRDHIGDAWYETTFFVPARWSDKRLVMRVGSASHHATMWVNGRQVAQHRGGFLPFEAEITALVDFGKPNRLTLAVNNILDATTLPRGEVQSFNDAMHPPGHRVMMNFCDFFNYAGIHRPVRLIATSRTHISDVTVTTDIKDQQGIINYQLAVEGNAESLRVRLEDADGNAVAQSDGTEGVLVVKNPRLWEPGNAYLYTMVIELLTARDQLEDTYRLPVGMRTIAVTDKQFLINGKPFYFRGFGKHEDADIRGKGHDDAINVKDFNLLNWIGANSFRTSHYPYSEEIMNLADRYGIVVIDECPAVGLGDEPENVIFTQERINGPAMDHHLQVMREMIQRDKNHPCVVMWSIANEPSTWDSGSVEYFRKVADLTRELDPSRPVTLALCSYPDKEGLRPELYEQGAAELLDVICVNRYFSWYLDCGRLDVVEHQLERDMNAWYQRFKKPVLLSEYGADTIAGLHQDPPVMFSEEYQCQMLEHYHRVLDRLDFIIGEHVWNFADFATRQGVRRVGGNKKGVFTRQRQPKAAAHLLRKRWQKQKPHHP